VAPAVELAFIESADGFVIVRGMRAGCLALTAFFSWVVPGARWAGAAEPPSTSAAAQAVPAPTRAATPVVETSTLDSSSPQEEAEPFPASNFGPRYTLERIEIRGNQKTEGRLIAGEIGLETGDELWASDPRVEAARIRLLSLGYFLNVHLALERGLRRGGAVLIVEVEERGTIILNALYLGSSAATAFWGGLDLAENNLLGRGISLGGGFVASTRPTVQGASPSLAARLRTLVPPLGDTGIMLTASALASAGSEFFRVRGPSDSAEPANFVALRLRRVGGVVGIGRTLTTNTRAFLDFREEGVSAAIPPAATLASRAPALADETPDFGAQSGFSRIGSLTATLDFDTRSDPLVPRAGTHAALSAEASSADLGSSYHFVKLLFQGSFYRPVWRRHVVGFHLFTGAIFGSAPIFDRFFVGDLDLFLPPRALGLNFSTQPSRNWLGTAISTHRYDDYAARVLFEYSIPLWRRHRLIYSGDAFAAAGAFGMASRDLGDILESRLSAWPISLTADVGFRLDTYIGVFTLSFANAFGRLPF
jgi:outer membrane protein insertion porin family